MLARSTVAVLMLSLAACVSTPPTRSYFKTPGISDAQWSRIDDECAYEAEKATASDYSGAVSYTWNRLYALCAKLKGATFVGRVTMPKEEWRRINNLCEGEAAAAVAGRPASRTRDELKEDLQVECLKRNGAVFRQSYYP
ncbi:hypothetical protein DC522_04280 [Microvirga sp. KLBC 81]|nr:hypothetical protein DC522_04280 [Microvirga sp. KLBC 81]